MDLKDKYTLDEVSELNVYQIRKILKSKGISQTGKKEELIRKLLSYNPDDNDDAVIMNDDIDDDDQVTTSTITPTKKRKANHIEELLSKEKYHEDDIEGLNGDELKEILRKHKLSCSGKKDELIERILNQIPVKDDDKTKTIITQELSNDLLNKERFTKDDINDLTKFNLKKILKRHNLMVSGKKEDLMERILNNIPVKGDNNNNNNDDDDDATDDMDVSTTVGTTVGTTIKSNSSSKKEKVVKEKGAWDDIYLSQESFTNAELEKLTVENLKTILASRTLSTSGTREILTDRIMKNIPLSEYPDVEDVTYERDSETNVTFSTSLVDYGKSKCERCEEIIEQGRPRVFTKILVKSKNKFSSYHLECFCRYKPHNISNFQMIKWIDSTEKDIAKVEALFNKYL